MTTLECLELGKTRLSTPDRWVKWNYRNGVQYCLLGACSGTFDVLYASPSVVSALGCAIQQLLYNFSSVSAFNDAPATTYDDIMRVLEHAIETARGQA